MSSTSICLVKSSNPTCPTPGVATPETTEATHHARTFKLIGGPPSLNLHKSSIQLPRFRLHLCYTQLPRPPVSRIIIYSHCVIGILETPIMQENRYPRPSLQINIGYSPAIGHQECVVKLLMPLINMSVTLHESFVILLMPCEPM